MTDCRHFDVAIWGIINSRAAVTLRRVAQACVNRGMRTVLLWSEFRGHSARTPLDYPVEGLEYKKVSIPYGFGPFKYPHPITLLHAQRAVRRVLAAVSPRCIVTQLDHAFMDRVWQHAAKELGIPGVVLQEGMANVSKKPITTGLDRMAWRWRWVEKRWTSIWSRFLPHALTRASAPYMFADYAFVWGAAMKRFLVSCGRRPESIVVTGSPALDHVVGRMPLVPLDRKTVIFVHQPLSLSPGFKRLLYSEILQAVTLDLGCRLIFKLHPGCSYETEGIVALAKGLGCPDSSVEVVDQGDVVALLPRASVVVLASSTTAYHAVAAGIPIVVLDYCLADTRFEIGDTGGAAAVMKPTDLRPILKRVVTDQAFRRDIHKGGERLIRDHLHALDGKSALRVAEALGMSMEGAL